MALLFAYCTVVTGARQVRLSALAEGAVMATAPPTSRAVASNRIIEVSSRCGIGTDHSDQRRTPAPRGEVMIPCKGNPRSARLLRWDAPGSANGQPTGVRHDQGTTRRSHESPTRRARRTPQGNAR